MASLFLAISMALDSYVACVSPIYYRRKFRREDSRILVGLFWVLCFVISIWPFRHTRWQCHIYYALSSPPVISIDPHIWANMGQFDTLPLLFYFCFGLLLVLIFPVFVRNRSQQHVKLSSIFLLSVFILNTPWLLILSQYATGQSQGSDRKLFLAALPIHLSSNFSILILAFDDKTADAIIDIFRKKNSFRRISNTE